MGKVATITKESRVICPICIPIEKIEWAGLIADRVELCDEHKPEGDMPPSEELK
jgi:hypothetical protein